MEARYYWRFYFSTDVEEELASVGVVSGLDPGEYLKNCISNLDLIYQYLDANDREVVEVSPSGAERPFEDVMEDVLTEDLKAPIRQIVGFGDTWNRCVVEFSLPESRAHEILELRGREPFIDSFATLSLIVGRKVLQNELGGGKVKMIDSRDDPPYEWTLSILEKPIW